MPNASIVLVDHDTLILFLSDEVAAEVKKEADEEIVAEKDMESEAETETVEGGIKDDIETEEIMTEIEEAVTEIEEIMTETEEVEEIEGTMKEIGIEAEIEAGVENEARIEIEAEKDTRAGRRTEMGIETGEGAVKQAQIEDGATVKTARMMLQVVRWLLMTREMR